MNDRCERIARAEEALDRASAALSGLERAFSEYRDAAADFDLLEQYLNSAERREDLRADEEGRLTDDLKRGVLSEDGIWNLLERRDELADELRAFACAPRELNGQENTE